MQLEKIPKVIHQFWIGHKKIPTEWMDTWKELNPGWEYVLWNEERLSKYTWENTEVIKQLKEYHGIKDVYQYEILYRFGGFFIDADTIALKPIPDYLLDNKCFTCYECEKLRGDIVALGYIGAVPNHPVFKDATDRIKLMSVYEPAWKTIGQTLWTNVVRGRNDVKIYNSGLFIPKHYTGYVNGSVENAICQQLWGASLGLYKNK